MGFRLDPALVADVQARTDNVTAAVEEGLRLWLVRARRRQARAPSPARPAQQQRSTLP
jgi:hypothetical protein